MTRPKDLKSVAPLALLLAMLLASLPFLQAQDAKNPKALKNGGQSSKSKAKRSKQIRGVTVSCWGWGAEWNSPGMADSMDEIQSLGGNWVTYHPYAWIRNNGALRHRSSTQDPTVLAPLKFAKQRKLKVMLKPHIGYWGSRFDWRGSISFQSKQDWDRFFKDYEDFIVTQANMAERGGAEIFAIGTEYKGTLKQEVRWRAVIKAVRKVYKGCLTYAANWDSYDRVPFWDALDVIGIQAYFPISQATDPSEQELIKGWQKVFKTLEGFSKKHKKSILFTELGYNRSSQAAAKPWDYKEGGPNAAAIKLRCMQAALKAWPKQDFMDGVFLWKWFPTKRDQGSRNFMLQYPKMKSVIAKAWKQPKKSKASKPKAGPRKPL